MFEYLTNKQSLFLRIVEVIKSCRTLEHLEGAERYVEIALLKSDELFKDLSCDVDKAKEYRHLRGYYDNLILKMKNKILKREYKNIYKISFSKGLKVKFK
jgi:hypothetical protein